MGHPLGHHAVHLPWDSQAGVLIFQARLAVFWRDVDRVRDNYVEGLTERRLSVPRLVGEATVTYVSLNGMSEFSFRHK